MKKQPTPWGAALKEFRLSLRLNMPSAAKICGMHRTTYAGREIDAPPSRAAECWRRLAVWSRHRGDIEARAKSQTGLQDQRDEQRELLTLADIRERLWSPVNPEHAREPFRDALTTRNAEALEALIRYLERSAS